MYTRIIVGVAAWLLGAATATGGSMLAVSLLGQGITGAGSPLLTQDAVHRALASEPAESAVPSAGDRTPSAAPRASGVSRPAATPAATPPPAAAAPAATVLTSHGGDVVASCLAAGVYLNSWSPLSGYEVGDVRRGPAPTARVTFGSGGSAVTMVVSCTAGVPSATTYSGHGGHGDD